MLLKIENYDNVLIKSIDYPIMSGGASKCNFDGYLDLVLNTFIRVMEASTLRFEGYVTHNQQSFSLSNITGSKREYTAVCKSFYEYSQQDVTIIGYGLQDDQFSGNGVDYQNWLIREDPNLHVLWPPKGDDPIIFNDQDASDSLPGNRISIDETKENTLPSHVKIEVKKYREKRFPVIAAFDYSTVPTEKQVKEDPNWANYGRLFQIMDPADPTQEYIERVLQGPKTGGSKFFVKGHIDSVDTYRKINLTLSASINTKIAKKTLTKKGTGGNPDIPGVETTKKNFCRVQMPFSKTFHLELPRCSGVHGTAVAEQECYLRARYLEEIQVYSNNLGGIASQHKLSPLEHTEIEVSADTNNATHWQDWTFGGAKGLLHPTKDLGGGVWTEDLSGTYIEEESLERAQTLLGKAAQHYNVIKYTTNIVLAGINWSYKYKVFVGGNDILLDSIKWAFGLQAQENRTSYDGVKLMEGFSFPLYRKNSLIEKQGKKRNKQKAKEVPDIKGVSGSVANIFQYLIVRWNVTLTADLSEGGNLKKVFWRLRSCKRISLGRLL